MSSLRTSYILLIALLLPMATVVLVVYYFTKLAAGEAAQVNSGWAYSLIALGGGLSAIMSVFLAVALLIVYKQRNRIEFRYRRQNSFLTNMLDERLRMARNLDVLNAAHQVTLAIKQETSFERIASVVLEQIEYFSRAQDVVVFAVGADNELQARARRGDGKNWFGEEAKSPNVDMDVAYEGVLANRLCRHYDHDTGEYAVSVPYATPDGIRGVVYIRRNVLDDPDFENELQFFETSMQQLVKAVSVGLKFSALWDRAIKDEMTGLFNKNHFTAEAPRLLATSMRSTRPICFVMLDVDKFKDINDTFGHLTGDLILRQTAAIMLDGLRESDMAFRFGGEELCVICSDTVEKDAAAFAERLRSRIAQTEFRSDGGDLVPVSVSIGVAEFDPARMKDAEDIKQVCDEALYAAKHQGRNLVMVWNGPKRFTPIERSGDVENEVKRRKGLGGDNLPLNIEESHVERRAKPKAGKMAKATESIPEKRKSPERRKTQQAIDAPERRKGARRTKRGVDDSGDSGNLAA